VLAFGTWRDIFWINLATGLVLAAVVRRVGSHHTMNPRGRRWDWVGLVLALGILGTVLLVMTQPRALIEDVTLGAVFVPVVGTSRWLCPLALGIVVLVALLVTRCLTARSPLLDLRAWRAVLRQLDVVGAALLATALAGVILAFATADPSVQVFSPAGPWLLAGSVVAGIAFWRRNRRSTSPLVPSGTMAATPAWGAMLVSFFVGAALIAALVDIPIFARITVYGDSQLSAALVLVRFLVGLPLGAFLGGWLTRRFPAGVVTAMGMLASCIGFAWMSRWGLESLRDPSATVPLVLAGLGVGLAMAPVNAALLSATEDTVHGVASALLVVARTVGKLVGVSALTTIGLRRYYAAEANLPSPGDVCPAGRTRCAEFTQMLREAGLVQLHTIFLGAAVCCVAAGLIALVVFRHADTRDVAAAPMAGGIG
jgi:MFS transporter, DHA2 family, triacylglyceride efflux pump